MHRQHRDVSVPRAFQTERTVKGSLSDYVDNGSSERLYLCGANFEGD